MVSEEALENLKENVEKFEKLYIEDPSIVPPTTYMDPTKKYVYDPVIKYYVKE
jgi:hypothetical protein